VLHHPFEVGGDAELVADDDVADVVDPPSSFSLQTEVRVRRSAVVM
jgi:hypothetical protein